MAKSKMIIESVEQDSNDVLFINSGDAVNFELNAEIVAGTLTSNAKELRVAIENELKNYTVERYVNDGEAAKKDKAFLNKVKDSVSSKRKDVTKQWNAPLDSFLSEMTALEQAIAKASDAINTIVKEADAKEKNEKREKIEGFWKTLDFSLVSLDKIFNPKWLNKTTKFETVIKEIEAITEKITTELATLRSMNDEDSEILQTFYLETLDLNATLMKGSKLKEDRETLRKQNEAWKAEQLSKPGIVETPAEAKKEAVTKIQNNLKQSVEAEKTYTYTLRLTGTKAQLMALRKYIDDNKIDYEKL